jgi:hypothetical protein
MAEMSPPSRPEDRWVLVVQPRGSDLDGYEFLDLAHALLWVAQGFVTDAEYAIAREEVVMGTRRCPECGRQAEKSRRRRKTYRISEFLARYTVKEDA